MTNDDQCTLSNSPLTEPYETNVYNYEDPDRSCSWLAYSEKFCYTEIEGQAGFSAKSDAMKKCVELGKNKCNAVKSSGCSPGHGPC